MYLTDGDTCRIAGWGNVYNHPRFAGYPSILRAADVRIVDTVKCQTQFYINFGWTFASTKSKTKLHLCAGDSENDAGIVRIFEAFYFIGNIVFLGGFGWTANLSR